MSNGKFDLTAPAFFARPVTPSDTVDLPGSAKALYIGTAGNLVLITLGNDTATFANVPAGTILPIQVGRVLATGTTASDIIALI